VVTSYRVPNSSQQPTAVSPQKIFASFLSRFSQGIQSKPENGAHYFFKTQNLTGLAESFSIFSK